MTSATQSSEFLLVPSSPLCPPESTPFPYSLSLISSPKGHAQALARSLGTCCLHLAHPGVNSPPFPTCVLPSCGSTGMSHQASGSCLRWGDLPALPPCHRQDYILCRQPTTSGVVLTPHHCQALSKEDKDRAGIKVPSALGQAGGGGQHYKGTNPCCLPLPMSAGDPLLTKTWLEKG